MNKHSIIPIIRALIVFIFLLLINNINSVAAGQGSKVTLKVVNLSIKDVLNSIEKQTGFRVKLENIDERDLSQKISTNFNQTPVDEVMTFIIKRNNNLEYRIERETITISKWKKSNDSIPSTGYKITGSVKDNAGNAVPGATIKVKNSSQGTTADDNGIFVLPNVLNGQKIVITSLGYQTKEVIATNASIIAELNPFVNNLNETQIIAYGRTTKRYNTGNVSTVKASEIQNIPVSNPLLALQGRIPGLEVLPTTGQTGGGVTLRLQGTNSLYSGNDPLIIVDNIPYPSQSVSLGLSSRPIDPVLGTSGGTNAGQLGSPLSFLNIDDIESIDVLKGADATSIYGSRAANGAILITTKRGKSGRTTVSINLQGGVNKVGKTLDVMDGKEYLEMRREAFKNDQLSPGVNDFDLNGTWDTTKSHNWQKELAGNTAFNSTSSLAISGGNENTTYLISGLYRRENYVFQQPWNPLNNNRYSGHINISSETPNKRFGVFLSTTYTFDDNKLPPANYFGLALSLPPIAPDLLTKEGTINWATNSAGIETFGNNPASNFTKTYQIKTTNLLSNLKLSFELLPGLNISSNFGLNKLDANHENAIPLAAQSPSLRARNYPSSLYLANSQYRTWNIEPMLTYKRQISKGKLELLVGSTITNTTSQLRSYFAQGFSNDLIIHDISSASQILPNNSDNIIYKYNAIFGRATYNYKDRYLVQVTGRRDGSSRFGPENRFHNFGSIAGGWIFSEEPFIQSALPFLTFGKLRSSYGTSGNDQTGDYSFLTLYGAQSVQRPYQGTVGIIPSVLTNPFLQWEETKKFEIGLETGLFENRLSFNFNYSLNRSSNQLMSIALPVITGFNGISVNLPAKVQNRGLDFVLSTINSKTSTFTWSTTITLSIPSNKLLSFPDLDKSPYSNIFVVGKSIHTQKLYKFAGVNDSTGVFQFYSNKGDILTTPNYVTDRTILLNFDPKFYGSFNNSVTYKNFSLNVSFNFDKRNKLTQFPIVPPGYNGYNFPAYFLDRWQSKGDNASYQRYSTGFAYYSAYANYTGLSDKPVVNTFFIRCNNINLSWELPTLWKKSMNLTTCNLYFQIGNAFVITNNKMVLDPLTGNNFPLLKTYNFGIKASL